MTSNGKIKQYNTASTLGLIRRNFYHCPASTRKAAYVALVRSTLEYGSTIWDPSAKTEIDNLEKVQSKAARFIKGDYKSRTPGCVTNMLQELSLPSLQQRRKELRLIFLFKIAEGMVPAIPADRLLQIKTKRKITAKKFVKCVT